MDNLLATQERATLSSLKDVTIVLTGSFWKYYRSPAMQPSQSVLRTDGGLFHARSHFHIQPASGAFLFAPPFLRTQRDLAANRWKSRPMEEMNRRKSSTSGSEEVFRSRNSQMMRRKDHAVLPMRGGRALSLPKRIQSMRVFPFSRRISAERTVRTFSRLSQHCGRSRERTEPCRAMQSAEPFIHWTSIGGLGDLPIPRSNS